MIHFWSKPLTNFYLIIWAQFSRVYIQLSGAYPQLVINVVIFCKTWFS